MQIGIPDPVGQTIIFSLLLILALVFSIRKKGAETFLSFPVTEELKGFAILAVIFSHIGYFLSKDPKFLFPLSVLAGVGVNLFLIMSGFGITSSLLKNTQSTLNFYLKRVRRLFIPLWLSIIMLLILDTLILHKSYPIHGLVENFLGFYPSADIFLDLDSPLWYFSITLFYYLIIPNLFWRKSPLASVLALFVLSLILFPLIPLKADVLHLWKIHSLAFPIGSGLAVLSSRQKLNFLNQIKPSIKYPILALLLVVFSYTSLNSGVNQGVWVEQITSLVTSFSIIGIFQFKPFSFNLFNLFGRYSYEIYLIHWPLLFRFDMFYLLLPAGIATAIYLAFFLGLGLVIQRLVNIVDSKANIALGRS